ncbi:MAG: hypothetical protein WCK86_13390 [Planctomycetia bacterium]
MSTSRTPAGTLILAVVSVFSQGCMQAPGYVPVGMPARPVYPWPVGPGGNAPPGLTPIGYPVTGNVPLTPVVPGGPLAPTVPVSQPKPADPPAGPNTAGNRPDNYREAWVAWPLPPVNRSFSAAISPGPGSPVAARVSMQAPVRGLERIPRSLPMTKPVRGRSYQFTSQLVDETPQFGERVSPIPATPSEDLRYRGGHTIPHLQFVNLYVGGDEAWEAADVKRIDTAISAAMSDQHLNNVMMQYFKNEPITSTALPSHPLTGYRPKVMTQADVEYCLQFLASQGYLDGYSLSTTVFNFLLPSGTVLTDDSERKGTSLAIQTGNGFSVGQDWQVTRLPQENGGDSETRLSAIPHAEENSSLEGLGGYHGSIRRNGVSIYYSVNTYSESRPDGFRNGIPVFAEPWKNVVATLYHELNEARTDPDVADAIRNASDPAAERFLGWTSDRGEECGDFPVEEVKQLSEVVREVPLADGSGTVPVQFQYSNAVHGPEGPIPQPHRLN